MVPLDRVQTVWHVVSPMLHKAIRHTGGRYRLVDVVADLQSGNQTLWIAFDETDIIGCTTISITQYPGGVKALCYEHLGGSNIKAWLAEGHKVLSEYARDLGCTRLECQGRSGWKPFLEELGYRQFAVRYECNLEA